MKEVFAIVTLALSSIGHASPLQKRDSISSCGDSWMAVNDVRTNHQQIPRVGFNSAVDNFCGKAGGQRVGGKKYLSMAARVWLDYGGVPENTGINGYVYFEIHNNRDAEHVVDTEKCKGYLKNLSQEGSKCYGKDHKDTKGGTWQVGNNDVSYHALANKIPPTFASVDKTVILDGAIVPLGNGGKGNTLVPFPTYTFNDIVPVSCHSHNDYERDTALYSALSAGCISVEADVYVHGDKLVVGHTDPGAGGQTIQDLYLNPIKSLIDDRKAVFPAKPGQGLYLLVDFKADADSTWDLLVKALEPLRTAGYLSHYDGGFKQGLVTVIASGNAVIDGDVPAPLAKANDNTANPGRALFVDARVDKNLSKFDTSNAYYASADFKSAVQGSGDAISGANLQKMRDQVKAAHDKGFKVRYWDIPSEGQWQQLIDEGIDRVNVDDLQDVASLDWKL
ncbi:hypothetical protein K505DRAFT_323364 [Melanomma pulvis-pyrius CBS 109.77]|uniref:Altered inheritance of mitochondria protein 6 n=1 Tax=Melanomma pulvis-pyrius CBS 109.77 TaxID=1314802 RepID=A0A6A6XIV1_9PLEO|nr:hypothetical protein K505DRAFT_323364 [Melanomma pulvis-pyrius CBS 109.77]